MGSSEGGDAVQLGWRTPCAGHFEGHKGRLGEDFGIRLPRKVLRDLLAVLAADGNWPLGGREQGGEAVTLGVDKLKHFAAGFLIALIGAYLFAPCLGLAAACLAGVAKETWDACHPPDIFDIRDLVATAIGGFAGSALIWSALGVPPC